MATAVPWIRDPPVGTMTFYLMGWRWTRRSSKSLSPRLLPPPLRPWLSVFPAGGRATSLFPNDVTWSLRPSSASGHPCGGRTLTPLAAWTAYAAASRTGLPALLPSMRRTSKQAPTLPQVADVGQGELEKPTGEMSTPPAGMSNANAAPPLDLTGTQPPPDQPGGPMPTCCRLH